MVSGNIHLQLEWLTSGIVYQIVDDIDCVNTFKSHLGKFWLDQLVMFDWKADLTGINSLSFGH